MRGWRLAQTFLVHAVLIALSSARLLEQSRGPSRHLESIRPEWKRNEGDGAEISSDDWSFILDHGSLKSFPTYKETLALLEQLLQKYPQWLSKFVIGESVNGKPLWAFRLGPPVDNVLKPIYDVDRKACVAPAPTAFRLESDFSSQRSHDTSTVLPQTLLTALHHAREPSSLVSLLFFVGRVLELGTIPSNDLLEPQSRERQTTSTICRYLLTHQEIISVPFVNPDGYESIEKTQNFEIRKNQRVTCSSHTNPAYQGVDLNRNYDLNFSSTHGPCDAQEYEGPQAFSEPETQAVKCLVESFKFKTALNFHSYGGVWTQPFNCCPDRHLPSEIAAIYSELSRSINTTEFGPAPSVPILGYTTSGEADDWLLARHGIISMSPEVGAEQFGFFPPQKEIRSIFEETFWNIIDVTMKTGIEETLIIKEKMEESPDKTPMWDIQLTNSGLTPDPTSSNLTVLSAQLLGSDFNLSTASLSVAKPSNLEGDAQRFAPFPWSSMSQFNISSMSQRPAAEFRPAAASSSRNTSADHIQSDITNFVIAKLPPIESRSTMAVQVNSRRIAEGACFVCLSKSRFEVCRCGLVPQCSGFGEVVVPLLLIDPNDPACQTSAVLAEHHLINETIQTPIHSVPESAVAGVGSFVVSKMNPSDITRTAVVSANSQDNNREPSSLRTAPDSIYWLPAFVFGELFASAILLFLFLLIISDDPAESQTKFGRAATRISTAISGALCCLPCCLQLNRRLKQQAEKALWLEAGGPAERLNSAMLARPPGPLMIDRSTPDLSFEENGRFGNPFDSPPERAAPPHRRERGFAAIDTVAKDRGTFTIAD